MRILPIVVAAGYVAGQSTPATSGWSINCQMTTGVNGTSGGAYYTSISTRTRNKLEIFYGEDQRNNGAIAGSYIGPNEGSNGMCGVPETTEPVAVVTPNLFTWPNQVSPVPESVYGSQGYFLVADGEAGVQTFDGCIAVVNTNRWNEQTPLDIESEKITFITHGCGQGNFLQTKQYYHYAKWVDINGDGDVDIVSARASSRTSADDPSSSGMVWIENPGRFSINPLARWEVHELEVTNGIADNAFDIMEFEGMTYAIAGSYAGAGLYLFSGSNWADSSSIQATPIIDASQNVTHFFATTFADLNMDGVPDVMATISSSPSHAGELWVFPGQYINGVYSLAAGVLLWNEFPVYNSNGIGSPGAPSLFYYNTADEANAEIPSILVSGDDDGFIYMFDPARGPGAFAWEYTNAKSIFKTKNFSPIVTPLNAPVVGFPTVYDLNGDGCYEIIVPATSLNKMVVIEQNKCMAEPTTTTSF